MHRRTILKTGAAALAGGFGLEAPLIKPFNKSYGTAIAQISPSSNIDFGMAALTYNDRDAGPLQHHAFATLDTGRVVAMTREFGQPWNVQLLTGRVTDRSGIAAAHWVLRRSGSTADMTNRINVFARSNDPRALLEYWHDGRRWRSSNWKFSDNIRTTPSVVAYTAQTPLEVGGEPQIVDFLSVVAFTNSGIEEMFWTGKTWQRSSVNGPPSNFGMDEASISYPVGVDDGTFVRIFMTAKTNQNSDGEIFELQGRDLHLRGLCAGAGWRWIRHGLPPDTRQPGRLSAKIWRTDSGKVATLAVPTRSASNIGELHITQAGPLSPPNWVRLGRADLLYTDDAQIAMTHDLHPGALGRVSNLFYIGDNSARGIPNGLVSYGTQFNQSPYQSIDIPTPPGGTPQPIVGTVGGAFLVRSADNRQGEISVLGRDGDELFELVCQPFQIGAAPAPVFTHHTQPMSTGTL